MFHLGNYLLISSLSGFIFCCILLFHHGSLNCVVLLLVPNGLSTTIAAAFSNFVFNILYPLWSLCLYKQINHLLLTLLFLISIFSPISNSLAMQDLYSSVSRISFPVCITFLHLNPHLPSFHVFG